MDEPAPEESGITAFGYKLSVRGFLAIILVSVLCYLAIRFPEVYGKDFTTIVVAVVYFYFGQNTRK